MENPELYYLCDGVYEFIMPENDVVLTVSFVPAGGEAHRINTECKNGVVLVDSDTDGDGRIAKAGEYIQFFVCPEEGYIVDAGGFVARTDGKFWTKCWFLGRMDLEYLGTFFVYEMQMPDGDVDVTVRCTKSAAAGAAAVRIPVAVR